MSFTLPGTPSLPVNVSLSFKIHDVIPSVVYQLYTPSPILWFTQGTSLPANSDFLEHWGQFYSSLYPQNLDQCPHTRGAQQMFAGLN
jgi:hypothetical protein